MEMALSELSLVLFTTLAPAGIAGYLVMAAFGLMAPDGAAARASRYLVVPLAIAITGLIASATHLGTPANALYVLAGLGRSPLSNEVVAVVGFLAVGGVYWMLSFGDRLGRAARRAWLVAAIATGLVALLMISLAYSVGTVPTWSLPMAPLTLWLGAAGPGAAVGLLGLRASGQRLPRSFAAAVLGAAAALSVADGLALWLEWEALGAIQTTVQRAADLVPHLPLVAVGYPVAALALLLGTARALAVAARRGDAASPDGGAGAARAVVGAGACCAGLLAACFAVRFCFYAMYMTAGV